MHDMFEFPDPVQFEAPSLVANCVPLWVNNLTGPKHISDGER